MKKLSLHFLLILTMITLPVILKSQKIYNLKSPDGKTLVHIRFTDITQFEVLHNDAVVVEYSTISMNINDGIILGENPKIKKSSTKSINETIESVVPVKTKFVRNHYNEIRFAMKGDYALEFRAYNDGISWRFTTFFKNEIKVSGEQADIRFPEESYVYFPEETAFMSHNERHYIYEKLSDIEGSRFSSTPALIETKSGTKVLISESGLIDYPGMWLKADRDNSLNAIFPGVALKEIKKNDRDVAVSEYADYIAVTKGTRGFPWRFLAIEDTDAGLVTNQLSFVLGEKNQIEDPSWIKPGKVSWDWWNAMNLYGVDFKSGVNTESYKYYIDFAAKYGIEYIIMDEGWYKLGDLMTLTPNINMEEILSYAKQKNVGVILWVVWKTLWDQWDEAFDRFEKWDIKGIKVDFMQRDDQWMVNYYEKVARECAKRKLLVDFHGAYKPAGLRRKYPNVITREGVQGLEHNKWSDIETPKHDVTLPFIRMVAGPMDYTPGAMVNAQKENFRAIWNRPMSQGTRCHQLAMFVVYESPLQMLADSPSHYYDEPECMEFLSVVPTIWDTTVVLSAKIADNIAVARKNGNEWYIGAMTADEKDITIDLSFLDDGEYSILYYMDGINAGRYAEDFVMKKDSVSNKDKMEIHLATGGGWAARIWKD